VPAPRKYPDELRERSIRFAWNLVDGPEKLSMNAACRQVGEQLGIQPDTLRNWVMVKCAGVVCDDYRVTFFWLVRR
jgi:transposase